MILLHCASQRSHCLGNAQQWHLVDCFSPNSTAAHQLRTDRCQDHCGSSVLLPLFFLPPSVPILSDMGNMLSHLGLSERKTHEERERERDKMRQKWVEGSPWRRNRKPSHSRPRVHMYKRVKCHSPKHQGGCCEDDALSGWQCDEKGVLYCSTTAVWCALLAAPLPCLFRFLPLSLTSSLIAPRTPSC